MNQAGEHHGADVHEYEGEHGTRRAFVQLFQPFAARAGVGATIFMPDPVNGRVFYTRAPATPARPAGDGGAGCRATVCDAVDGRQGFLARAP